MPNVPEAFRFDHRDGEIIYGRESISEIGEFLSNGGLERALLVCGSNTGSNDELMDPIRDGLGDRHVGTFDGTTTTKTVETVYDGLAEIEETKADVLIGIGGGSSLDIARNMSAFKADGRSLPTIQESAKIDDVSPLSQNDGQLPVIVIPTTFAGADMATGGSIEILPPNESPTDQPIRIRCSIEPKAMWYDPSLFETTPFNVLTGSAMNGFNKGIERIYSRDPTPITDGTALHGLSLLQEGLSGLSEGTSDSMDSAVAGLILVQFHRKLSVLHAFGHGFTRYYGYPVQQGVIHAILVPQVLEYVFEKVDGRRSVLAEGLNVDVNGLSDDEIADEIVSAVVGIRDSLDLPVRLRSIDAIDKRDFSAISKFIINDEPLERMPADFEPTREEVEEVLHRAW